ncbi:MAG: hydantoinase/oxoprolinase family protein [Burkholderiaceae bacterium]
MNRSTDIVLGVDVGGTFTDVLALDRVSGAIIGAVKVPSTRVNPADGAITGVDRYLSRQQGGARAVFHGTTVGTNTLIEKKGGRSVLVTTRGFRDVLALRRQARPRLYDLAPQVSPPLVDRERRLEVDERLAADGAVLRALDDAEVTRIVDAVCATGADSVAVCLLHAYANDVHERRLGEAIAKACPGLFVTLSSDVCCEFREYERTSTAVVNAYIGPAVSHYIDALKLQLDDRGIPSLAIVKSNGGLTSAANAARYPAQLIESGPAAGITAAAALGREEGFPDLIAFDLGGTTAKVGVVRGGQPRLANEFDADRFVAGVDRGGYPIKSPVVDIIEIGAGGGSIARVDASGVIKVGPQSAGAEPGPACYGRGGEDATVTDAHVCLGHIGADGFGSEDLAIDPTKAEAAVRRNVADPLGWSVARAAAGILRLATANMAEMVRLATLRRGLDPRNFVMVAFGGGGALHAAQIAREVGVGQVLVPPYPGLFSAIGTVLGELRHDLVQTVMCLAAQFEAQALDTAFAALRSRADVLVAAENQQAGWRYERHADLRFEGQLFELTLPVPDDRTADGSALDAAFRVAYRESYGYDLESHAVEVVSLRLVARCPVWRGGWPAAGRVPGEEHARERTRTVYNEAGEASDIPVLPRGAMVAGRSVQGPAIIEDFGATIRALDAQTITVRPSGLLVITNDANRH